MFCEFCDNCVYHKDYDCEEELDYEFYEKEEMILCKTCSKNFKDNQDN